MWSQAGPGQSLFLSCASNSQLLPNTYIQPLCSTRLQTHRNIELSFTSSELSQKLQSWYPTLNLQHQIFPQHHFLCSASSLNMTLPSSIQFPSQQLDSEWCPVFKFQSISFPTGILGKINKVYIPLALSSKMEVTLLPPKTVVSTELICPKCYIHRKCLCTCGCLLSYLLPILTPLHGRKGPRYQNKNHRIPIQVRVALRELSRRGSMSHTLSPRIQRFTANLISVSTY